MPLAALGLSWLGCCLTRPAHAQLGNPPGNAWRRARLLNSDITPRDFADVDRHRHDVRGGDRCVDGIHCGSPRPRRPPFDAVGRGIDLQVAWEAKRKGAHAEDEAADGLLRPEVDPNLFVADLIEPSAPGCVDSSVGHASDVLIVAIRRNAL